MKIVEKCNETKGVKKRGRSLFKAEPDFNLRMDIYPQPWQEQLKIQKAHDEVWDKIELYQKESNFQKTTEKNNEYTHNW